MLFSAIFFFFMGNTHLNANQFKTKGIKIQFDLNDNKIELTELDKQR